MCEGHHDRKQSIIFGKQHKSRKHLENLKNLAAIENNKKNNK